MKEVEALKSLYSQGQISRRDFLRHTAVLGISATVAGSMLASTAVAQTPQTGGHLVIAGAGSSTDSADPTTYDSFFNGMLGRTFGNRLVSNGGSAGLVPRLATSWDVSDDLKTWTVQIRDGVEFHNGKSLTADDVVYSIRRHFGPDATSGFAGNLEALESVEKSGPLEITMQLSSGNLDWINQFADYHMIIQPEGSTDDGVGTGPFVMESLEPGVRAMFSKNPNYWGTEGPYYNSFEILVITDDTARAAALQTGKVHAIDRVDPKITDFMAQSRNVNITSAPSRGHYNFLAHTNTDPYTNPDLILAMKYAMPRQQIIDQVLNGFGGLGNDHPINSGYALFEDAVEQRSFDIDQAAFHYKKSGHTGPIILESSSASWPGATDGALLFSEAAKGAGMDIQVKRVPADGYWSDVWNVRPFCSSYWISRETQDQILTVAYTGDWNDSRFENARFSELLPQARVERDTDLRAQMYTEMQQLIHDHSGALIPVYNAFIDAVSTDVQGFESSPSQSLMDQLIHEFTWFG